MNGLPMELEKKQIEIKACMKNYQVLDEFHHRWDDDEEYDKMWRVYGAPLETVQRIEKQGGFLEKEKDRFIKQMEAGKKEFNNDINELESLASGFKQFGDMDNFEDVAANAKQIKAKLDDCNDKAKNINNRETLVEYEDITDYTAIPSMQKEFKAYYDLWTTVEIWKKSHAGWMSDPFDEVDASAIEDTVDNANKTMAQVIRYFRDKELPAILQIAE